MTFPDRVRRWLHRAPSGASTRSAGWRRRALATVPVGLVAAGITIGTVWLAGAEGQSVRVATEPGLVSDPVVLPDLAPAPAYAQPATCRFVLGFAEIRELVGPEVVGDCLEDQRFGADGDAVQHTTGGLLVWRRDGNLTAFTDGATTWVNGPHGVQSRPNDEWFSWEAEAESRNPAMAAPVGP